MQLKSWAADGQIHSYLRMDISSAQLEPNHPQGASGAHQPLTSQMTETTVHWTEITTCRLTPSCPCLIWTPYLYYFKFK